MKHLQIYEDFRIVEKTPNYFYIVLRHTEETFQSLSQLEFENIMGISDNPSIIKEFFDIRPIMLIMNAKDVLNINDNLQKIDYMNPHSLVSNNFEILTRLKQDKKLTISSIFNSISNRMRELDILNDWKNKEKNYPLIKVRNFFIEHQYEIESMVEEYIKTKKVDNLWDFTNLIMSAIKKIKKDGDVRGSERSSYRYGHDYNDDVDDVINNPKYMFYILQETLLEITKHWKQTEGEWIVKKDKLTNNRTLKIPLNSKLLFKTPVTDEEELKKYNGLIGHSRGYKEENFYNEKDSLSDLYKSLKQYNLNDLYQIEFVEGYLKALDMYKNNKYTNTKQYSNLMKYPLDKRVKKNFYSKRR